MPNLKNICGKYGLYINEEKTKVMIIDRSRGKLKVKKRFDGYKFQVKVGVKRISKNA